MVRQKIRADCQAMKKNQMPRAQELDDSPLYYETHPPRRILVVEDNNIIRRLNTKVLANSGYDVDAAEDGAVAWDVLQQKNFNLLVTDNNMPKVSGVELLKKLYNARIVLPVIMVSGAMPTLELKRQPWLEVEARLEKPYAVSEFLATVRNVLLANDNNREPMAPPPNQCGQTRANRLRL